VKLFGALRKSAVRQPESGGNRDHRVGVDWCVEIAVQVWRLRRSLAQGVGDAPTRRVESARRWLEELWESLGEAGIEVRDLTGKPYDVGMTVKVVAWEAVAGLKREVVLRTVKPAVLIGGRVVQMAEVIVGICDGEVRAAKEEGDATDND